MKVVAVSDTHNHQIELPEGDLLIVAGDMTMTGSERQIAAFGSYIERQAKRFSHRPLVIAGNHDFLFERERERAVALIPAARYLEDELIEIDGVRIYGSPWTPTFFDWAFMKDRGSAIRERWDLIPERLDILITHGPPHGILDYLGQHVGCEQLLDVVTTRLTKPPRHHVFGHIHEGYGRHESPRTQFLNVAVCNEMYSPCNPPTVFEVTPTLN